MSNNKFEKSFNYEDVFLRDLTLGVIGEFYRKVRWVDKWEDKEKELFNFYLKASAIRFFLTRLYDLNFNNHGQVKHKNPNEFYKILNFHKIG